MIWGCRSRFGYGIVSPVAGKKNSQQLINIMTTPLLPSVDEVGNKLPSSAKSEVLFH